MAKRLLVLRPGAMGDICMAVPIVRGLAERFSVTWLVWQQYAPLLRCLDVPCRLIAVTPRPENKLATITDEHVFAIRESNFDAVLDLCHWPETSRFVGQLRDVSIRAVLEDPHQDARLGLADGSDLYEPFSHRIPAPRVGHQIDKWRLLVREAFGLDLVLSEPRPVATSTFERHVFVHPHSGKASKLWPISRFVEVLTEMNRRLPVVCHINSGGRPEWARALHLWARLRLKGVSARIVFRDRSYARLCRVLRRCHFALGCDSGPMHLASLLGLPSVVVFGPYAGDEFRPYWRSFVAEPTTVGDAASTVGLDAVLDAVGRLETSTLGGGVRRAA